MDASTDAAAITQTFLNGCGFEPSARELSPNHGSSPTWLSQRLGYGQAMAPYWFVGMEEAGLPDEIAARLSAPFLEDLREAHWGRFGGRYDRLFLDRGAKLQPTWNKLIRALLVAKGQTPSRDDIRRYQATRWGRRDGETLLTELYPVASPQLSSAAYKAGLFPVRARLLRDLQRLHQPRFVIAYGATYADEFKAVFGEVGDLWRRLPDDPGAGEFCGNVAIVPHPTSPGQTNARFELIGRWAQRFTCEETRQNRGAG